MTERFYQQLAQARTDLEGIKDTLNLVKDEAGAFAPDDPEPYGTDARALYDTLANLRRDWTALAQRRRELLSAVPAPAEGGLERLRAAVERPFHWARLRQDANDLMARILAMQVQAAQARRQVEELRHKPLLVARRCRELVNQGERIEELALILSQAGLYGPDLEAIPDRFEQSLGELQQVPACFLEGADGQILAEASKDDTAAAWRQAGEVAGQLQAGLDTLAGWQAAHERFVEQLEANAALLDRTEVAMQEAKRAREYPVAWGTYRDRLIELRTLAKMAGEPAVARTTQQLAEQAKLVQHTRDTAQALEDDVDKIVSLRQRLVPLLNRANLAGQPAWLAQARDLIPKLEGHPSGNWSSDLRVQALPDDLRSLEGRLHQWVPAQAGARLLAPQLESQFAAVRDLVPEVEAFRARLDRIAESLGELEDRQQEARQELAASRESLVRLVEYMKRAEPSLGHDLAQARRQVEDARRDCDQAARYFERSSEPLAARLKYVERRFDTHRRALQFTLSALAEDLPRHRQALQFEVEGLEALARLDREPSMVAARRLLKDTRDGQRRAPSRKASPSRLAAEAEARLQVRHDLFVALGSLRSQVADPIAGLDRVFSEARETALARYESLVHRAKATQAGAAEAAVDTARAARLVETAQRDELRLKKARTAQDARGTLQRLIKAYRDLLAEVELQERT